MNRPPVVVIPGPQQFKEPQTVTLPYQEVHAAEPVFIEPLTDDEEIERLARLSGRVSINPNGVEYRNDLRPEGALGKLADSQIDARSAIAAPAEPARPAVVDATAVVKGLQRIVRADSDQPVMIRSTAATILHDLDRIGRTYGKHSPEYLQRLADASTVAATALRDPQEVSDYAVQHAHGNIR